jgi:hypothetical protein
MEVLFSLRRLMNTIGKKPNIFPVNKNDFKGEWLAFLPFL